MYAKSYIDIVEKRHLAKRQIHEVTDECKKDTCKMRTLIGVCEHFIFVHFKQCHQHR